MFKCGQEIYVINICPLPFGFCKSITFFTGSLFPRAVSEFTRGFSEGKIQTRASVCVSYLEISDLEKTLMLLERVVTTCIRLLRKRLMWWCANCVAEGRNWRYKNDQSWCKLGNTHLECTLCGFIEMTASTGLKISFCMTDSDYVVDTPFNHMSGYTFSNTSLSSKWDCSIVLTSIFLNNKCLRGLVDPLPWVKTGIYWTVYKCKTSHYKCCLLISCKLYGIREHKKL